MRHLVLAAALLAPTPKPNLRAPVAHATLHAPVAHATLHAPVAHATLHAPVAHACISSPFGPRRRIGPQAPAAFHRGVDLRAPAGGIVSAVGAGTVIGIHRRGPGGLEVVVRHSGFTALYAHLGSVAPALAEGATRLAAGQRIGVVGRTGVTYGTHLYFEMRVNGAPVDPAPLLGLSRCG